MGIQEVKEKINSYFALVDDGQICEFDASDAMNDLIVSLDESEQDEAWDYKQDVEIKRIASGK